jgi:hypothetical protein
MPTLWARTCNSAGSVFPSPSFQPSITSAAGGALGAPTAAWYSANRSDSDWVGDVPYPLYPPCSAGTCPSATCGKGNSLSLGSSPGFLSSPGGVRSMDRDVLDHTQWCERHYRRQCTERNKRGGKAAAGSFWSPFKRRQNKTASGRRLARTENRIDSEHSSEKNSYLEEGDRV